MVATGDLVRRYASGHLYRVGRISECVWRHGVLVSPAPAEAALSTRPGVTRAAVVMAGDGRLLAGVEADQDIAEGLRDALTATLPGYLVPDRVVKVDVLPLLPSGAIDRAGLLCAIGRTAEPAGSRPVSHIEREVERAWQAVLGRPTEAGRSFFESGGDSVRLIRLRGLLAAALDCQIDVVELFRHPTARAMAAYLRTLLPDVGDRTEPASEEQDRVQTSVSRGLARQRARQRLGESRREQQEVP